MEKSTISKLLEDFEKTAEDVRSELGELKATMIVNFGGGSASSLFPKLINGDERGLDMIIKIGEHFLSIQKENEKLKNELAVKSETFASLSDGAQNFLIDQLGSKNKDTPPKPSTPNRKTDDFNEGYNPPLHQEQRPTPPPKSPPKPKPQSNPIVADPYMR